MPQKRLLKSETNKLEAAVKVCQDVAALFNDDNANKIANDLQELRGKYADAEEPAAAK